MQTPKLRKTFFTGRTAKYQRRWSEMAAYLLVLEAVKDVFQNVFLVWFLLEVKSLLGNLKRQNINVREKYKYVPL